MKQPRKLTKRQREILIQRGYNPLKWFAERHTTSELRIISKETGELAVLQLSDEMKPSLKEFLLNMLFRLRKFCRNVKQQNLGY